MQKSRFTEAQMVTILREADRRPVPEVAKQHGVSAQTIYSWRKHFGTLEPADVKRLRQLEQENGYVSRLEEDGGRSRSGDRRAQGDHTKKLAIDVAGSIRSGRVIEVLGQLVSLHGAPRYLRSDNGPEFIATALLRWLQTVEIDTAFIDPGKPWQNGTDESFNGKFRNECLSLEWFRNRMEAKIGIERWRRHYNEERPHMSLGDLTPAEFKKQMGTTHGWLGESLTGVILQ